MFWKRKEKTGEVVEVQTSHGLAYAQRIHDSPRPSHKSLQVMRMIEGFHAERPSDLAGLVNGPTVFYFHMALHHVIKHGHTALVGNLPIPAQEQVFPIFRSGLPDPRNDSKMEGGWLIQGNKSWLVNKYTTENLKLSFDGVWGSISLKNRLEIGWRPELDIRSVGKSKCTLIPAIEKLKAQEAGNPDISKNQDTAMTHYLYFKTRQKAEPAVAEIRARGFRVKDEKSADDKEWLVLVFEETKDGVDIEKSRDFFEGIASKYKGEYDGWEAGVLG